jgi:uncharacterized tellurite resistance protein B-like protein
MRKIDKLRNLLVMAALDGKLSEREIRFLTDRCQRWGVSDAEFAGAVAYAMSADAELTIPPRKHDRLRMLQDLVSMMAADGALAEVERNLFALIAAKMEISDAELNALIDALLRKQA